MRKTVAWLIAVLMMVCMWTTAGAEKEVDEEILFRGLPWMMDMDSYIASITEEVQYPEQQGFWPPLVTEPTFLEYTTLRDIASDEETVWDAGYTFTISDIKEDVYIAGYKLSRIVGATLWQIDESGTIVEDPAKSRVIRTAYDLDLEDLDLEEVWADLKNKLDQVYGDRAEVTESPADMSIMRRRRAIWFGGNNTYVMLVGHYEVGADQLKWIEIEYGRSDIEELPLLVRQPLFSFIQRPRLSGRGFFMQKSGEGGTI